MKILEIINEAKPDNLGQGLHDKLFATFKQRDANSVMGIDNGIDVANLIFKYSGPNKLIWTCKQYNLDQYFFLHDLPDWKTLFELFDRPDIKSRLQKKDINQYANIDELKTAVMQLVGRRESMTPFDHILEAVDKFVQKGEAEWLYKGSDYAIYHPRTFYSSNVLLDLYGGRDIVDVCTVTGKQYFSEIYAPHGCIIYTLTPDNFFVAYINQTDEANSEFSDKTNNHTDYTILYQLEHFPELYELIGNRTTDDTTIDVILALEPDENKRYGKIIDIVERDGSKIKELPIKYRTEEVCLSAVLANGDAIEYVPVKFVNEDLMKKALDNGANLMNLQHFRSVLTPEICEYALTRPQVHYQFDWEYVPMSFRDYEMRMTALMGLTKIYDRPTPPNKLTDFNFVTKMLAKPHTRNFRFLGVIPRELQRKELYIEVFKTILDENESPYDVTMHVPNNFVVPLFNYFGLWRSEAEKRQWNA